MPKGARASPKCSRNSVREGGRDSTVGRETGILLLLQATRPDSPRARDNIIFILIRPALLLRQDSESGARLLRQETDGYNTQQHNKGYIGPPARGNTMHVAPARENSGYVYAS